MAQANVIQFKMLRTVFIMNQRLVESVAQTILAMSEEERQLLEQILKTSDAQKADFDAADKSFRVAEISKDIQSYEAKYHVAPSQAMGQAMGQALVEEGTTLYSSTERSAQIDAPPQKSAYSFFKLASQINIEGPEDWSVNVDHYLYGTPKAQHD